jgi:polyhydroxyalkanoate synthesis regulator protein
MYGDSMQGMVPHYLEASMAAFSENQNTFRDAALKPFEQLAKQNLALFQAASEMLSGGAIAKTRPAAAAAASPSAAAAASPSAAAAGSADSDTEMAALKAQLAALQARLDGLAKS